MMRFSGRMEPGRGGAVFTGQSESSSLPASRKAMRRPADLGPSAPRFGCGFVVSCAALAFEALSDTAMSATRAPATAGVPVTAVGALRVVLSTRAGGATVGAGADVSAPESATVADASPSAHAVRRQVARTKATGPSVRSDISGQEGANGGRREPLEHDAG